MPRKVLFADESRAAILRGVNTLANAVKVSLGPRGRCVMLEAHHPMFPPKLTKDGVSIAKEIRDFADPFENAGANIIRQAASATSEQAGDGTTTATLLAQVIYQKGLDALAGGSNPVALKRGIDAAVTAVVEHIKSIAQPVTDNETIARVGTISSNGDRALGELIAKAMEKVGKDGVITITESADSETTLKIVEGMQLDRGWLNHMFVANAERLETVFDNPLIFITERKLFTMTQELSALFSQLIPLHRPVLIIAGDYDQPFVITLITNNQQGVLKTVPIKAPAFGDLRRATLEDIAIVTGGYAFTEDCGRSLESATLEDFGSATRVTIGKGFTTIAGGKGSPEAKEARMTLLRSLIPVTENQLDAERMKQRLARLSAGVAEIRVGAATEAEQREKQDRVDDAVCATKAAVEEGIVAGGGLALLSAYAAVDALLRNRPPHDESVGIHIILEVIEEPMRQICLNAGADAESVIAACRENIVNLADEPEHGWGYNAATEKFEDLIESGVIDPAQVVRCALQNAASCASTLLLTEASVANVPEAK